jgi:predicted TIM-barrel fold metal-dependent hydrolase
MGFVDVDSHLLEAEATWGYLDPGEVHFRPKTVEFEEVLVNLRQNEATKGSIAAPPTRIWIVDDTWSTRLPGDSNKTGYANIFDPGATELSDPTKRIADLDALGVDVQLLLSTFFIVVELDNPLAEAALARSYNRWVADVTTDHLDRFRWALRPPLRILERAFAELEFGASHGAAGLHLRGIEHGMFLSDPYFHPLYERAQDLDLAIFVHLGAAVRRTANAPIGRGIPTPPAFMENVYNVMAGFHAVISSDLHRRFPRLRWGFLEAGASWAPTVLQQHRRLVASASSDFLKLITVTPEVLEEKNIFLACQADEDIAHLVGVLGEHVLCAGTDYGHNDIGAELGAHAAILGRTDISQVTARRIVDANGRKLLGLAPATQAKDRYVEVLPARLPNVRGAAADPPILVSTS